MGSSLQAAGSGSQQSGERRHAEAPTAHRQATNPLIPAGAAERKPAPACEVPDRQARHRVPALVGRKYDGLHSVS
jgi:hypothetical protein